MTHKTLAGLAVSGIFLASPAANATQTFNEDIAIVEDTPAIVFNDTDEPGETWFIRGRSEFFLVRDVVGNRNVMVFDPVTSSTSLGPSSSAGGIFSIALGLDASAAGQSSSAIGDEASASGSDSVALGFAAVANGDRGTSLGRATTAIGQSSTAVGDLAFAEGISSTALGNLSNSAGTASIALGQLASSAANFSTAIGRSSSSPGDSSTAMGREAVSQGNSSIAIGREANTFGDLTTAVGPSASATTIQATALGHNANAAGLSSIAIGFEASTSESQATAIGPGASASGGNSAALGLNADASGIVSLALGVGASAAGRQSVAIGFRATTTQRNSIVLGSIDGVNLADEYSDVAIGTTEPLAPLHIFRGNDTREFLYLESNETSNAGGHESAESTPVIQDRAMMQLVNNGGIRFQFDNAVLGTAWRFQAGTGGNDTFEVTKVGSGEIEFRVDDAGNATLAGMLFENSDRNAKTNIETINPDEVLAKLTDLPISEWEYKDSPGQRHVGPMAQDFRKAFGLGANDTSLATIDTSGVALASIQSLARENLALKERLTQLETIVSELLPRTAQN